MKPSVKLWVKALRSGEYKQGQKYLKQGNKYCCLGVAIAVYNTCHKKKVEFTNDSIPNVETLAVTVGTEKVKAWLNLTSAKGGVASITKLSLTAQNDRGDSFDDIADFIESNPEGLFIK